MLPTSGPATQPTKILPLNRIRVETALSRFPIHRLAKKGSISIDLQRLSDNGEADFKWEVTYNVKHGQPGPLAYKVDTLLVYRRIDEVRRPLPEVIKLGSLSTMCAELGLGSSGNNIGDVKRALHQNASAYITAKIRYKQKNGRERWGEIGYTRYSVVFTGENLPDGRSADAVYIVLNPSYRDLLNHVELRPLDYDYLVELAPGPQRLYELLSFPMYGALSNGRDRAKLIYSDYCLYAPQTRYLDFEHVKKQMYKVHAPHRQSGYIVKVDYQETSDREGNPDWEIFYTPGDKAFLEHQAFARRHTDPTSGPIVAAAPKPQPSTPRQQTLALGTPPVADHEPLLTELTRRGITEKKARELLDNQMPSQEIMDQIEWTDAIVAKSPAGKFHNPPGLYIAAIRDNVTPPGTFLSSRKRRLHKEAQQAKSAGLARRAQQELAYAEYRSQAIESYIYELPEGEYQQMLREAHRQLKRSYTTMTEAQLEELAANWVRADVKNSGGVQVLGFEEFCGSAGPA
ncbi:MAG: hypothetical protein M3Y27_24910 [Acidobacteriota bacterium]|nr:hypothetical protein [Acidobacteriota bacterium]